MFSIDFALAFALLLAPPEQGLPCGPHYPGAALLPQLQAVALALELIDPREVREIFSNPEKLPEDLKLVRQRQRDLHDAPPLHDCMRFPDRSIINDYQEFNRRYREQLLQRQVLDISYRKEIKELVLETEKLYRIWDLARDARTEYYYVWVRRDALKKLRDHVGAQAYLSGCLPPHVPVWSFMTQD